MFVYRVAVIGAADAGRDLAAAIAAAGMPVTTDLAGAGAGEADPVVGAQIDRGTIPGSGGTQRLPRLVGAPVAIQDIKRVSVAEPFEGRPAAEKQAFAAAFGFDAGQEAIAAFIDERVPDRQNR